MSLLQNLRAEFSGGCELLFGKKSCISLSNVVPVGTTLQGLVQILKSSYIVERPDQFVDATGSTLRPGVLALVNNCDAEVMGGMAYVLEEGDLVEFVSTLHGG
mmetsp:Transcript_71496/g.83173  ORF Transcript_71496/g.83173 Transcript_71496/m.83173 type:complete len:103 (-) Transcript_71496:40-348(-)|eukprot:CAMPEP_0176428066 /NCGR_PEP_ID=MMETSP0127-20121128/12939_1 /TAXON_ID=938130 /ORGANISM="Platyophrya macrostoma, Strain WH" /LENGTH=102 /DNA_ID=CAMNT_0017809699 /DNA_START=95 /DNA_END=403 /DNA_ORIENTATION=-